MAKINDSINPFDWIAPETSIFIVPQMVIQSSDPTTSKFTIRHGCVSWEEDKPHIITDHIENGAEIGGFHTFEQVIDYIQNEGDVCAEIAKFKHMGMNMSAAQVLANRNRRTAESYLERIEYDDRWDERARAWNWAAAVCREQKEALKDSNNAGLSIN